MFGYEGIDIGSEQERPRLLDFFQRPIPPCNILQRADGCRIKAIGKMPRRIPTGNRIRRDISSDDTPRSNHSSIANADAGEDGGVLPYPDIVSNRYRPFRRW